MKPSELRFFQQLFENLKEQILATRLSQKESLQIHKEDTGDEVDRMSSESERALQIRLQTRENSFLKKIHYALHKIKEGTYGLCEDCGEEIELARLQARPTSTLCVACKEEQERTERVYHRSNSQTA